MCAASGHDADMLYATRFYADDPFVWWEARGKSHIALSPLEIDRAKPVARARVHANGEFLPPKGHSLFPDLIGGIAAKHKLKSFLVPEQFPAGLLEKLRAKRLKITVSHEPFFPQRSRKTEDEVRSLTAALRVAEKGLRRGIDVLRASKPGKRGFLKWGGVPLTSERLRAEMDAAVLHAGGSPANTIVAGGLQGCDPHERGHGPLRANEAIVLDIFPRHATNFYFGDLTRTVVRGRASEALRKQYATVQKGKRWVMKQMRAGADGPALQKELIERFKHDGYPTEQRDGPLGRHVPWRRPRARPRPARVAALRRGQALRRTQHHRRAGPLLSRRRRRPHRGRRHRRQDRCAQSHQVRGRPGAGVMKIIPASTGGRIRLFAMLGVLLVLGYVYRDQTYFLYSRVPAIYYYYHYDPQEGDVIFQSLPHNDLVDAIEGISHSPYSHCGVVLKDANGNWAVIEAIGSVHETSLISWIFRGRGGNFTVYRLDSAHLPLAPKFKSTLLTYRGMPYDMDYDMMANTNEVYCSSLVYLAFQKTTGEQMGRLEKLGDLDWKPFAGFIMADQMGHLPLDRVMITPASLARAPQLHEVYHSGW